MNFQMVLLWEKKLGIILEILIKFCSVEIFRFILKRDVVNLLLNCSNRSQNDKISLFLVLEAITSLTFPQVNPFNCY